MCIRDSDFTFDPHKHAVKRLTVTETTLDFDFRKTSILSQVVQERVCIIGLAGHEEIDPFGRYQNRSS